MPEDFESSQARIAAAAARSAEFQNMVREWNMRNQMAFLPGILGQGQATADFYTNQPRTMFVSDRFQPQGVQEYPAGALADIEPWTGLPEDEDENGNGDGLADRTVFPGPIIFDQSGRVDQGTNEFVTSTEDLIPVDPDIIDVIPGGGPTFDPRTDIGQFFRDPRLGLNPAIDIDFLTEAVANSIPGMGGPEDWMYWANKIMGQELYQGDEARSYTGPIGGYGADQGDGLGPYTGPIGGYSTDQGDELRSYTGPIINEDQGLRPDQYITSFTGGDQGMRPDQFTSAPIFRGDQGLRPDQFSGVAPFGGDQGLRPDQFTSARADFGISNLEDLTTQYAGDYTPPVSLAQFDDETLDRLTRQQGESEANVPVESPIERILMDVRDGVLPAEDAVAELVTIGLPKADAIGIIIAQTEGRNEPISGVLGA